MTFYFIDSISIQIHTVKIEKDPDIEALGLYIEECRPSLAGDNNETKETKK